MVWSLVVWKLILQVIKAVMDRCLARGFLIRILLVAPAVTTQKAFLIQPSLIILN